MVKTKAFNGSKPAISMPIVTNSMEPAKIVAAKTGAVHHGNPWLVAYSPNPNPMKKKLIPTGIIIGSAKEKALRRFISLKGFSPFQIIYHIYVNNSQN